MSTELDYVSGATVLPKDSFGISPSSIGRFFSEPHLWYRDMFLGEKSFTGSSQTVLGTIMHYCAEKHVKHQPLDHLEIYKYIYEQCCHPTISEMPTELTEAEEFLYSNARLEFDVYHIIYQYPLMAATLIATIDTLTPTKAEELVSTQITDTVWASGSVDLICNRNLYDYKSTSALTAPSKIDYKHKLQLLTYAYIHIKNGTPIDTINIIYITNHVTGRVGKTNKPLADYPSTSTTLTHTITAEDIDFTENILKLIAETVEYTQAHPDLAYIIYKDYRLKSLLPIPKYTF